MRRFSPLLAALLIILSLLLLVVAVVHAQDETTLPDDRVSSPAPSAADERAEIRNRNLGVTTAQWVYVPMVLSSVFFAFLLISRKFKIFGSKGKKMSFRVAMGPYVSEEVYHTLDGATEEFAAEQRKAELGHQFFQFVVICILTGVTLFGGRIAQQPLVFAVLILAQLFLLWMSFIMDIFMIKVLPYLRIVRSVNTKLRLALVSFQSLLFCVDSISASGLSSLPIDCFQIAIAELSRESVAMLSDGMIMLGFTEAILVVLVVENTLDSNNNNATGIVASFGLSCLSLSCMAIIGGMVYKIYDACKNGPDNFVPDEEGSSSSGDDEGKPANGKSGPPSPALSASSPPAPSGKSQAKPVAPHPKAAAAAAVSAPAKSSHGVNTPKTAPSAPPPAAVPKINFSS